MAYGDNDDEEREAEQAIAYIDHWIDSNWTDWLVEVCA